MMETRKAVEELLLREGEFEEEGGICEGVGENG